MTREVQKADILAQYEEILSLTHDTVMLRLPDGTITYWNRGGEETYGYKQSEAIGKKSHVLLRTEFPISLADIQDHLAKDGRWDGELCHFAKDGTRIIASSRWSARRGQEGEIVSIIEINNDITAQRESEIAERKVVEADRGKLAAIVESSEDPIIGKDLNGLVQTWNEAATKLFGYCPEEMIGRPISLLFPPHIPDSGPEILAKIARGERIKHFETIRRHKDGHDIDVALTISPIKNSRGDIVGVSKIVRDISERKRAEALLQQKMVELQRSNEELEQFAYVCSHDLQEPLRVISNYSQLLAKRYSNQLDDKGHQFIEFTVDASKRMQTLINDVLTFSRVKTKAQEPTAVDCNEVMKMVLANLRMSIAETGAEIKYENLPTVYFDKSQLLQIFQNLIGNAIKFRSDEKPVIIVNTHSDGKLWTFCIKDNGIGIDMQFAERIFAIFQRLHVKEKYPGSGIGLSICKRIVERHGGRIWLESDPGQGSSFYFTVPSIRKAEEQSCATT